MSTKTKKLSAGVPIVDSNGAVTPVTIAELARQVGKELGVQKATYSVAGPGWIRLARIDSNAAILMITNVYVNTPSRASVIAVSGAYTVNYTDAKLLSGNVNLFDKIRFVGGSHGEVYLEAYSSIPTSYKNQWCIALYAQNQKGATSDQAELYQSFTIGSIPEGFTAKELTLTDLQWGGVNTGLSSVYASLQTALSGLSTESLCITKNGGLRHECKDKEGIGIATGRYARLANRTDRRGDVEKNEVVLAYRFEYKRGFRHGINSRGVYFLNNESKFSNNERFSSRVFSNSLESHPWVHSTHSNLSEIFTYGNLCEGKKRRERRLDVLAKNRVNANDVVRKEVVAA